MTKNRTSLCLLLGALALASCRDLPVDPDRPGARGYVRPVERFALDGVRTGIDLFALTGQIHVVTAREAALEKRITVSAASPQEAAAIAERCTVTIRPGDDGRTKIAFHAPLDLPRGRVGADTTLRVPGGLDLTLRTGAGLIDTRGYRAGAAVLETRDGTILAGDCADLRFETASGRVEIAGRFDRATGSTRSADLLVRTLRPGSRLEFDSKSGACTLLVPDGCAVDVRYRTAQGEHTCEVPGVEATEVSNGTSPWHERRLTLPGQGPACEVFVQSEEGGLRIRRAPRIEQR